MVIFQKILPNENFWQFFLKKCQVFGNFLTVKWQFSRGSGKQPTLKWETSDVGAPHISV